MEKNRLVVINGFSDDFRDHDSQRKRENRIYFTSVKQVNNKCKTPVTDSNTWMIDIDKMLV